MSKIIEVFCKLIPKIIPANVYLLCVNLMALRKVPEEIRQEHCLNNRKIWRRMYEKKWSELDFGKSNNVIQQSEEIVAKDSSKEMEEKKERFNKAWKVYVSFIEEKERKEANKWRKKKEEKNGFIKTDKSNYEADNDISKDSRGDSKYSSEDIEEAIVIINETLKHNKDKFYIERQPDLKDLLYGMQNDKLSKKYIDGRKLRANENSCEVIAVYNASLDVFKFEGLLSIDSFVTYLELFESKGIVKSGYFGTSGMAIYRYYKDIYNSRDKYSKEISKNRNIKLGVEKLTGRRINKKNLERFEKEYKSYILMSYNNARDISEMVHTICISKTKDRYKTHNDYEGSRESKTLYDAVFGYNEYASKPIMLIGLDEYD